MTVRLPDPDSAEMGRLVDRWLVTLRKAGVPGWNRALLAYRLARALDNAAAELTPGDQAALAAFLQCCSGETE